MGIYSKSHLHIGLNNIIGDTYLKYPDVEVVTHMQARTIHWGDYRKISVSAFNPEYKRSAISTDSLLELILKKALPDTALTYYSTARVFDRFFFSRHSAYIQNKLYWESELARRFKHLRVVYLPLLFSRDSSHTNFFFDSVFKNLKAGKVLFDCDISSSWNIVDVYHAIELVETLNLEPGKFLLCSDANLSIRKLVQICLSLNPHLNQVDILGPKVVYPDFSRVPPDIAIVKTKTTLNCVRTYMIGKWETSYAG